MDAQAAQTAPPQVNLVVRNVYTPSQSLALSVDPQTLVGELKRRLSAEFPSAPAVSAQKLIFGGKICGDDEPLAQVLAQVQKDVDSEEPVVFHLLVSASGVRKSVEPAAPKQPQCHEAEPAEAQDSPRPSSNAAAGPPSFSTQPATSTTPAPQPPFLFGQAPAMTQQQQNLYRQSVLMQQQAMVLQQIQYLQFMLVQQRQQQAAPTPTPDAQQHQQHQQNPFGAHFAAPYANYYGMMQPQMFHAQARPNAAPHAATPAPAQAQTPAAADAPADRPMLVQMAREVFLLLDVRMALKMAFMLFIIGQDTPIDRILMLGLLSFISYLHITGIFAKIYDVYSRRRSANGDAEPNAPADPNAPGAADAAGAAIANRYGMLTRVLRISPDRGFVQDVKYFVVGLLLSLVPAWHPQPIQGAVPMADNAMPDDVPLQGI
ncbi:hypothetical protein PHYPSEUDO_008060 [Phytophthora pseudosyringae]|uniref:Ubiquitin-like domain-containing protein n=1 Tax=Phytophthora pseudosyringae TaxID=221518 RepID=A0A8T1VF28_9STRA|nr:hypothetical protein PHYPSEUDO_008060 [Phytophthora pseudosyringae]